MISTLAAPLTGFSGQADQMAPFQRLSWPAKLQELHHCAGEGAHLATFTQTGICKPATDLMPLDSARNKAGDSLRNFFSFLPLKIPITVRLVAFVHV